MQHNKILIRQLGLQPYEPVSQAMHEFTDARDEDTLDEIWLVEHHPVFTQGQAGKAEHVLVPGDIPVIQSDRGGQVTYHGPGTAGDVRPVGPQGAVSWRAGAGDATGANGRQYPG